MKKLDKFILKSFIGPFLAVLLVVTFILMMQFLWVYIDELVGKGLTLSVILEFMGWGGTTLLPLSLPLATLLASVMTLGQMSENYELFAIKSAGISLARVMAPLTIASLVISIAAFFAANDLVPVAYNKIYTLRDDIGSTKEEINIPAGTFYDGIEGYVLRVDSKNKKTGMMYGVMVYDHTGKNGGSAMIMADSAMMKMSKAKDYLTFSLYDGINYQEENSLRYNDTTMKLDRVTFSRQEMVIPLANYAFQKSEGARFGDQIKTQDVKRLRHRHDSVTTLNDSALVSQYGRLLRDRSLRYLSQLDTAKHMELRPVLEVDTDTLSWRKESEEANACKLAVRQIEGTKTLLHSFVNETYDYHWNLNRSGLEILKKYAGALACLIMFLIGAPLGAFTTKKSGLGAYMIFAVLFFVLYWVVDTSGSKLARDGATSAWTGAFASSLVLLPMGVYLSYKAINDSAIFKTDDFSVVWKRFKSKITGMFKKTRIVYMGTPEFAVAPLDALVKAGYKVVACVTVADKPSGRGLKMNESAVKKYAVEHGIPVLQPLKLKDPAFLEELRSYKADLFVVVAFRMLPEEVWKMPPLGTFNLHAALLPQYRGAAPINWAVINGERISGATTFMIDHNIDTGGIMLRQDCRIAETDTAGDLHDKLMPIGADLVLQTVQGIIEGNIETRVQKSFIQGAEVLKSAPKLSRELCHIDWDAPVKDIYNLIRGLSPYPAAFTELERDGNVTQLKIYGCTRLTGEEWAGICGGAPAAPGTIFTDGKNYMAIAARDGGISLKEVQLSGKKKMDVKSFLLGFRDLQAYVTTKGTSAAVLEKVRNS